jgi:hypothetical protein
MSITATSLSSVVPTAVTSPLSTVSSTSTADSTDPTSDATGTTSFSQMGQLMSQLQSLEQTDPAQAKSVLATIGSDLKADAGNNPMMSQLADKFTQASQTGDLSALQPPKGGHGGGHHHHHGGGGGSAASATTQAASYDQSSDPMAQIESAISSALQST